MSSEGEWRETFRHWMLQGDSRVHMLGVGNPIRGDDAAGLEVANALRRALRASPTAKVKVHDVSLTPEREVSKIPLSERLVLFDAVEAGLRPGSIVCGRLNETKYGYFATHNVPFRLIPGLEARGNDVLMLGIQPESVEVIEGLSKAVRESTERLVRGITETVEEMSCLT